MTTEDDFQAALDTNPEDWQTRLVFADWLQDRGDSRADGYRALGALRKQPRPDSQEHGVDRRFFTWFQLERQSVEKYHTNSLPRVWFLLVRGGSQFSDYGELIDDGSVLGDWVDFPSRCEAEDAAARGFANLPAARRAELLAATPPAPPARRKGKGKK